ncbi:avidin/streptavidin family protein [Rhizobium sp. G187]|uniref:avidin/streptavidin family protein n=1 Tax=Rhizobium sp. G187 TaxID=3451352 RepID=UPI003EE4324B
MKKLLVFLVALLFSSSLAAHAPFNAQGFTDFDSLSGTSTTWVNELGSVMTIDVDRKGGVTGYFVNNAPGTGCRGLPYDLSGHAHGSTIAFSVVWSNGIADCRSATSWAGYARKTFGGGVQIVTQWSLAFVGKAGGKIETGQNVFTYQAYDAQPSPADK